MVGVAGTETLQVNVINLATLPPNVVATASCAGTISFANASGAAIGTPVKFSVGPGQIFSAPLPFSKTGYSSRGEILASVQQTVTLPSPSFCTLAISLEVFDTNSGVIHAAISTSAPGGPQFASFLLSGVIEDPLGIPVSTSAGQNSR